VSKLRCDRKVNRAKNLI